MSLDERLEKRGTGMEERGAPGSFCKAQKTKLRPREVHGPGESLLRLRAGPGAMLSP